MLVANCFWSNNKVDPVLACNYRVANNFDETTNIRQCALFKQMLIVLEK